MRTTQVVGASDTPIARHAAIDRLHDYLTAIVRHPGELVAHDMITAQLYVHEVGGTHARRSHRQERALPWWLVYLDDCDLRPRSLHCFHYDPRNPTNNLGPRARRLSNLASGFGHTDVGTGRAEDGARKTQNGCREGESAGIWRVLVRLRRLTIRECFSEPNKDVLINPYALGPTPVLAPRATTSGLPDSRPPYRSSGSLEAGMRSRQTLQLLEAGTLGYLKS